MEIGTYVSKLTPIFAALDKIAASASCEGANINATSVFRALSKKSSAPLRNFSASSTVVHRV